MNKDMKQNSRNEYIYISVRKTARTTIRSLISIYIFILFQSASHCSLSLICPLRIIKFKEEMMITSS